MPEYDSAAAQGAGTSDNKKPASNSNTGVDPNLNALQAVLSMLMQSGKDEVTEQYRLEILRRIAEESDVKPSRIPAPLNITEVGGYFNLIEQVQTDDPALQNQKAKMQLALIASALGLPI